MDNTMARKGDPSIIVELIRRILLEVNTSIPGEIVSFDSAKQTATVRACIRTVVIDIRGEKKTVDLPPIFNVPVWFPYSTSTGFSITYPVNKTDQCLLIFSQRSIDNWMQYGSVQDPADPVRPRIHDFTDAVAIVGLIPNTNTIEQFQTDGIEIRNKDREVYIKLSNSKIELFAGSLMAVLNKVGDLSVTVGTSIINANLTTITLTSGTSSFQMLNNGTVNIESPTTNVIGSLNVSTGASGTIGQSGAVVVNGIVTKIL